MSESQPGIVLALAAPDIATKAPGTRRRFLERLRRNLEEALSRNDIPFALEPAGMRFVLRTPSPDAAASVLRHLFGLASVAVVEAVAEASPQSIAEVGGRHFRTAVAGKRFAVRAKKLGSYPFSTQEIERSLGARLRPVAERVDLTDPEVTIQVELQGRRAYLYTEKQPAVGGLPAGIQGRALALVSGGFDSVVAAWRIMRRGAEVHFLYCNMGGLAFERLVLQTVKVLYEVWGFGLRPRLHVLDFTALVRALQEKTRRDLWQLVLKVLFYRAAAAIARIEHADAVITGEALGQVSSQTLPNIATLDRFAEMPMLRPLIACDKNEIIEEARRIGTAPISERVPELCGLALKRPAVSARVRALAAEVEKLDPALLEAAIRNRRTIEVAQVTPEELRTEYLFIDHIPEDAVVVDCREPALYRIWHVPGAINIPIAELLERWRTLDRSKRYVLYCTFGTQTPHVAELMQQAGYEAYAFKGGIRAVERAVEEAFAAL